jgi:hypothetical protein
MVLQAGAVEAPTLVPDRYLLLVIDADTPAGRGWAEVIVVTHNRPKKYIITDAMENNKMYTIAGGKPVKLGEIYSIGGEGLVMSVINVYHGLGITKYAKTTYAGLNAIAGIFGRSLDITAMKTASKSDDRSVIRREQLKFIDAFAYGLGNLTITKMYSLFVAAFKHVDSNISIIDAFNLSKDLLGGTFIPNDGRNLSFEL